MDNDDINMEEDGNTFNHVPDNNLEEDINDLHLSDGDVYTGIGGAKPKNETKSALTMKEVIEKYVTDIKNFYGFKEKKEEEKNEEKKSEKKFRDELEVSFKKRRFNLKYEKQDESAAKQNQNQNQNKKQYYYEYTEYSPTEYMNVVKYLKNKCGFDSVDKMGMGYKKDAKEYIMLRISGFGNISEKVMLNDKEIKYFKSLRVEINGDPAIKYYCAQNQDLAATMERYPYNVKIINKSVYNDNGIAYQMDKQLAMNFRMKYNKESSIHIPSSVSASNLETDRGKRMIFIVNTLREKWHDLEKSFRYINRVKMHIPESRSMITVDLSAIKSVSVKGKKNFEDSLFESPIKYEIELEANPKEVIAHLSSNNVEATTQALEIQFQQHIQYILAGLQQSDFPISNIEAETVFKSYLRGLLKQQEKQQLSPFEREKEINERTRYMMYRSTSFIGPNLVSVQIQNVVSSTEAINQSPFISLHRNYVVTDKADGQRKILFLTTDYNKKEVGKINQLRAYFITNNMEIQFTGLNLVPRNKETKMNEFIEKYNNTIIDGEHITENLMGEQVNQFYAFDIYFVGENDVRYLPFFPINRIYQETDNEFVNNYKRLIQEKVNNDKTTKNQEVTNIPDLSKFLKDNKKYRARYEQLNSFNTDAAFMLNNQPQGNTFFNIKVYHFIKNEDNNVSQDYTLVKQSSAILNKQESMPYKTDGLIYMPAFFGVGGQKIGDYHKASIDTTTKNLKHPIEFLFSWEHNMKWKPPKENTVDFLLLSVKNKDGSDYIDRINTGKTQQKIFQLFVTASNNRYIGNEDVYNIVLYGNYNQAEEKDSLLLSDQSILDHMSNKYKAVPFYPTKPSFDDYYKAGTLDAKRFNKKAIMRVDVINNQVRTLHGSEPFGDKQVVECFFDMKENPPQWKPLRIRHDKTAKLESGEHGANSYYVAQSNWESIHHPVTEKMLKGEEPLPRGIEHVEESESDIYYSGPSGSNRRGTKYATDNLKSFHNLIKEWIIDMAAGGQNPLETANLGGTSSAAAAQTRNKSLIDLAVGQAGDLYKWHNSGIKYVFGVDISKDNIVNVVDGACMRFLNYRMNSSSRDEAEKFLDATFLVGDCGKPLRHTTCSGSAFAVACKENDDKKSESAEFVLSQAILRGHGKRDEIKDLSDKSTRKNLLLFENNFINGFDICSCQFAMHYFFKDDETLLTFIRNIAENTKVGGYFVATAYDGLEVVNEYLKNIEENGERKLTIEVNGGLMEKKIFAIRRKYSNSQRENFISRDLKNKHALIGLPIEVFQESIGKYHEEYLVHPGLFKSLMEAFGFKEVGSTDFSGRMDRRTEELTFRNIHAKLKDFNRHKLSASNRYKAAENMTPNEKTISFLNRCYCYKKSDNPTVGIEQTYKTLLSEIRKHLLDEQKKEGQDKTDDLKRSRLNASEGIMDDVEQSFTSTKKKNTECLKRTLTGKKRKNDDTDT